MLLYVHQLAADRLSVWVEKKEVYQSFFTAAAENNVIESSEREPKH